MALKDIMVLLDSTDRATGRLGLAAYLAKQHDAHVTGLYVVDVPPPPVAWDEGAGLAVTTLMERQRQQALAEGAQVETIFRERLRLDAVAGTWRLVEGDTAGLVATHARYADLTILGQQDPDSGDPSAIVEEALFSSGRPLLIIPFAGKFLTLGRKALVGWNASREAARAVNDALPLLQRVATTTVVTVGSGDSTDGPAESPANALARHLERHGIRAGVERIGQGGVGVGEALLDHAADVSADVMVIGAYSHSRVREILLGGVTRTILRQMTLPVLMSH